jgi:hemerythrin-like domain-containing protein
MSATADLRSEHGGVGRMLRIMDAMALRLRAGEQVAVDDLSQSIEFLRVFVDQCHHTKEEDLLFPAMRAAGMASAEETIVTLLADHVRGREAVARIAAATQRLADAEEAASVELAEATTEYTGLLRAHILREEGDCFTPADHELSPATQEELAEGYERIERDVVGEGRHEAFHALLDRLSQVYHA